MQCYPVKTRSTFSNIIRSISLQRVSLIVLDMFSWGGLLSSMLFVMNDVTGESSYLNNGISYTCVQTLYMLMTNVDG